VNNKKGYATTRKGAGGRIGLWHNMCDDRKKERKLLLTHIRRLKHTYKRRKYPSVINSRRI